MDLPITTTSLERAARNILREIGSPPSGNVLIFCSREKFSLAEAIGPILEEAGLENHTILLGNRLSSSLDRLRKLVEDCAGNWGLIVLLHPQHSSFLFKAIGRPDLGVRIPEKHLFCDWLINLSSLVRTYDFDWDELLAYRQSVLDRLSAAKEVHVTTASGTDLHFRPRSWRASMGEVWTAPIERSTRGKIFIDGCAYGGRPEQPFLLEVDGGRVTNLQSLDRNFYQQKWVLTDLTRDENSRVLAEFGIGINPGAMDSSDLMEAEQARGTCHFGFGNNLAFGGMNASSYHFDLVVLAPSIEVDGVCLMQAGKLVDAHHTHPKNPV